jgi:ABC-2 type transport system permease protein
MSTSTTTDEQRAAPTGHTESGKPAGTAAAFRWEMTKLAAQGRARYTLLICLLLPIIVVLILNAQARPPKDTLYGRWIHHSGYAMPLLILGFAAQWVFPLMTAIVAGDIFASEDQHGTWKTVLTRSVSRSQLFWAKTLTATMFAIATLVVFAASTIISSLLIVGHQPLVGLTGQLIPSGTAVGLVIASWALALLPLLGFTALSLLLSVRSRNPAIGIVAPVVIGLIMQLSGSLGGLNTVRQLLLTTPFESWHGLLAQQRFYGPLLIGVAVCASWTIVCLGLAFRSLRRRDITGG